MQNPKRFVRIAGLVAVLGIAGAALAPLTASALPFAVFTPVGSHPTATVISPDDTALFVANRDDSTISVMDVSDPTHPTQAHLIDLEALTSHSAEPSALALSSDGNTLYVADVNTDQVHELDVSDPANPLLVWSKTVGDTPTGLALSADNLQLVVSNEGVASISVVTILADLSDATTALPLYLPNDLADPNVTALSPTYVGEGGTALAVADGVDSIWLFETTDFLLSPQRVEVGDSPRSIVYVPMFLGLYVAGETTLQVVLSDLSIDPMNVFPEPGDWSVAFSPDFSTLALTNSTGGYVEFHGTTGPDAGDWRETLGTGPTGVIFSHDGQTAYAANTGSDTISAVGIDYTVIEATPAESLLATTDISLPANPQFMNLVTEDDPEEEDHWLAGRGADCGLEVGFHPYSTQNVTVTSPGTYTFRVVGTTPNSLRGDLGYEESPIEDPFLAVYRTFDAASPDTGVVGCDDDRGVRGDTRNRVDAVSGAQYDEQWSYFTATLEPGTYDLVLTTYDRYDAATWGETDADLRTWDAQVLTATFELWGPTGGLTISGESALAQTGSTTATWSLAVGVLALLAGATALTVTRRRRPMRTLR
jgi:LPXTG-motif cell wall-anchored protein